MRMHPHLESGSRTQSNDHIFFMYQTVRKPPLSILDFSPLHPRMAQNFVDTVAQSGSYTQHVA